MVIKQEQIEIAVNHLKDTITADTPTGKGPINFGRYELCISKPRKFHIRITYLLATEHRIRTAISEDFIDID